MKPAKMMGALGVVMLVAALPVQGGTPGSIPAADGEQLRYSINWPSGLNLGEAQLSGTRSKTTPAHLSFQFQLDAAVPGFQVSDHYRAEASSTFCSTEFDKKFQHGNKKVDEKTVFSSDGTAKRETAGGGHTEMNTPSCARDALTYLYYLRKELSEGRLPPEQTVYFGAPYQLRVEFGGTQQIQVGDKMVDADKLLATVKSDSANVHFEMYFLKDAARTLALVNVPLAMGKFSMVLEK